MPHPPIYTDPETGLKAFNTRAAQASQNIKGKGYAVIDDGDLKILPNTETQPVFDAEEQEKYRDYKQAREGAADYTAMEGKFTHYLDDVYSAEPVERDSLDDACDVLVVGAGFAGLLLWHKLQKAGFKDVRFCEKGGDVGGTWYWNRYPGVACDVEAYSYLPLLEEMGYFPSMKFASGFEILEYCRSMAEKFDFYPRCLFHTTVEESKWNDEEKHWLVKTDRGDEMKARVVILANGILTTPKLARIEGMESFAGDSFHTSRWKYDVELNNKTIGIIGTGATAVQTIPELAKIAKKLIVFQRTPSTIDIRDQRKTTDEEIALWKQEPGWARARRARFAKIAAARSAIQADDDYLSGRTEMKPAKKRIANLSKEEILKKQLNSNFRLMEQIRARVDAVVKDPATAEALKPYYPYGCKRPTFHDEFLPTFNRDNVTVVDTAPKGVSKITPRGVVHDGVEYPLDILVYATGFQWMASATFNNIIGKEGESLSQKWARAGTKTFLGIHSRSFPNLFIMTGPQGGGGAFNFTETIDEHADYIVWMLNTLREKSVTTVDVKESVELDYALHCQQADIDTKPFRDCYSYYNGEGQAEPGSLAYYGTEWDSYREKAQIDLLPYEFS